VHSLGFAHVHSSEGALHGVDAGHVLEFFEESHTGCTFLGFLHSETRGVEAEVRVHFGEEVGQDSTLARVVFKIAPVHEYVLLPRMAVQIAEHDNCALFMDLLN